MDHLSARITGRVQGVNFRHFTMTKARSLELQGWVRNARDGSVEVEAQGPREDLESLLSALRQGPPAARVQDISAEWLSADGSFEGFEVRY